MAPSRASTYWGVSSSLALILILTIASTTVVSALLSRPQPSSSSASSTSASDAKVDGTTEGNDNNSCRDDDDGAFPNMMKEHFSSIGSTQDEARRIVTDTTILEKKEEEESIINMVCVTATEQTNGRGTSGRAWMGARGNTFVTIAIPQQRWMQHKHLPLTLLPLQVGILVAERVQALLENVCDENSNSHQKPKVTLKWPNDVLVNEDKIAGILIESSSTGWFLIGIGVNLAHAPPVPTNGPNHGRTSTSISDHCAGTPQWDDLAYQVGVDLAQGLNEFLDYPPMLPNQIVEEWKQFADFNMELTMRDTPKREKVKVVDMLPDGRIQVVGVDDGVSRVIVADYFI